MWYSKIEVKIGRSLKKAKGEEEKEKNKLSLALGRNAKKTLWGPHGFLKYGNFGMP